MRFWTLKYAVSGRIARITLNRPARLNAIDDRMPREIRRAVEAANEDDRVHVIILAGAGRAFCAGYYLKQFAEGDARSRWNQPRPWPDARLPRDEGEHGRLLRDLAQLQAGDLQGARLRGRRRQRIALCADIFQSHCCG